MSRQARHHITSNLIGYLALGCIDPATDSLDGAIDVEVSPDGTSAYVVSSEDSALTHFSRATPLVRCSLRAVVRAMASLLKKSS